MVLNLSSVEFLNLELIILAHCLDPCIPSRSIRHEEVYSELDFILHNSGDFSRFLKTVLVNLRRDKDLAHAYAGTAVSSWESDWRSEHFRSLKSLRNNNSIITWPNNGSGVVILDYQCYVDKMMSILGDTSKFLRLGPVDSFDHTTSIETEFQRRLVELVKRGLLSSATSD